MILELNVLGRMRNDAEANAMLARKLLAAFAELSRRL